MREIKFRGKRKDNNEWIYGSLSIEYDKSCFISYWENILIEPENNHYELKQFWYEVFPESVGQYTGIKDKKGNEIYEGDILKWTHIYTEYQTHTGDNIPNGSYTEPCGVISKWLTGNVSFINGKFTTNHPDEEENLSCPLTGVYQIYYDRSMIQEICFGNFWNRNKVSDVELWEACEGISEDLKINPKDFNEFYALINGVEIVE